MTLLSSNSQESNKDVLPIARGDPGALLSEEKDSSFLEHDKRRSSSLETKGSDPSQEQEKENKFLPLSTTNSASAKNGSVTNSFRSSSVTNSAADASATNSSHFSSVTKRSRSSVTNSSVTKPSTATAPLLAMDSIIALNKIDQGEKENAAPPKLKDDDPKRRQKRTDDPQKRQRVGGEGNGPSSVAATTAAASVLPTTGVNSPFEKVLALKSGGTSYELKLFSRDDALPSCTEFISKIVEDPLQSAVATMSYDTIKSTNGILSGNHKEWKAQLQIEIETEGQSQDLPSGEYTKTNTAHLRKMIGFATLMTQALDFLEHSPYSEKPFVNKSVEQVRRALRCSDVSEIFKLKKTEVGVRLRILKLFGYMWNDFFASLWTLPPGMSVKEWKMRRGLFPEVKTGAGKNNVVEFRGVLANYLGFPIPNGQPVV